MIFLPLEERTSIPIPNPNGGINRFPLSKFILLDKNRIKAPSGDVFEIKDLLKKQIEVSEIDGVLTTFSNAALGVSLKLEPGIITRIDAADLQDQVSIPKSYKFFAVSFLAKTINGDPKKLEHYIPFFENCDGTLLFTRSSHPTSPKDFIGAGCFVTAYFHKPHNEAWKEVLYKSLYELSQKNFNISLVLLFSAIDILTKNLLKSFDLYDNKKHGKIIYRLSEISGTLESQNIIDATSFEKFKTEFDKKVTKPRNNFEHEHELVSYKTIIEAYLAAFDIIWYLDQIEK
ncbi:MAG: hypothetical protein V4612_00140 [Pseudomonadota bacterium]